MNLKQNMPSSKQRSKMKGKKISDIIKGLRIPKLSKGKLSNKKFQRDESTQKCAASDATVAVVFETITVATVSTNHTDESIAAESNNFVIMPRARSRTKSIKSSNEGKLSIRVRAWETRVHPKKEEKEQIR